MPSGLAFQAFFLVLKHSKPLRSVYEIIIRHPQQSLPSSWIPTFLYLPQHSPKYHVSQGANTDSTNTLRKHWDKFTLPHNLWHEYMFSISIPYADNMTRNKSALDFLQSIWEVQEGRVGFAILVVRKYKGAIVLHALSNEAAHPNAIYQHRE